MHILKIIFLLVLRAHCGSLLQKCCKTDEHLRKNYSIYSCVKDEHRRLQIFTHETNLWENETEGTCVDTYPVITEYIISNRTVVEEKQKSVNFYYTKCCPLGDFYHSETHSCVEKANMNVSFITGEFIKVGLPECRVIVDYKLTPGNFRMDNKTLIINGSVEFLEGKFCIDRDENDNLISRGCHDDVSVCHNDVRCIHKCCPDGQSFVGGKTCTDTYVYGLNLNSTRRVNNSEDPFAIIHGHNCRSYIMSSRFVFYVDTNGTLLAYTNKTNSFNQYGVEEKSYCIEHIRKGKINEFAFLMCMSDKPIEEKFVVARWAKIISCIFIVLTVSVYCFLPEMLNLFGKILMNYCASMLATFIILIYAQFQREPSDTACLVISFSASFLSLASFSWMNVMCFDIWWTFGAPKAFVTAMQKKRELKRFLLYILYGWGLPTLVTFTTLLVYGASHVPDVIKPILGSYKCFWERRTGNYGMLLYYVCPLILIEIANLVFFLRTVFYCLKVKGEINRMNDNRLSFKERKKVYNVDKEQLFLILKLSVTMGISFTFEVVSSLFDFSLNGTLKAIENVWDTINCLQGVFIFLIFIFKEKVYRLCRNKIFSSKDRKISISSSPTGTTQVIEPLNSKSKIRN